MQFSVKARTLLQLGAELISSDGIAFYELIKNAFDASSPRVVIDVQVRVPHDKLQELRQRALRAENKELAELRRDAAAAVDAAAPDAKAFADGLKTAQTLPALLGMLRQANTIQIADQGHGMSRGDLEGVYLQVGTPFRLHQRQQDSSKRILGEKGLGRLSTMRLGWHLTVRTTRPTDDSWHVLTVDWREFAKDPDADLDDIEVAKPKSVAKEKGPPRQGTVITIGDLISPWTSERLRDIARLEFSRLTDPFTGGKRYPITLRFNREPVPVPSLNEAIFKLAHARVTARFTTTPHCRLVGRIDYYLHNRELVFDLGEPELVAIGTPAALRLLGPFELTFYWYNRKLLTAEDSIGDRRRVLELMREWANGVMVFRDGFRVNPYGGPDDDWLDLDKKALGSGGYKVNRHQIIGKVEITSSGNPHLVDQTNREGLRATAELRLLTLLLKHVMWVQFKTFLDRVDKDLVPDVTLDELAPRVRQHRKEIRSAVRRLAKRHPAVGREKELLGSIDDALKQIASVMRQAQQLADVYESRRNDLVHLAGIGLMVEILAHELNRSTHHALEVLNAIDQPDLPKRAASMVTTLKAQLKTLNTRLRVLDPLSTSGRQRKERFDIAPVITATVDGRAAQFTRHGITVRFESARAGRPPALVVTMVRGMVIQVLENLIANSVYWLDQARTLDTKLKPRIDIVLDPESGTLSVTDNGPGVAPSLAERVFEPFFSTKPPDRGKGLGLYISKEIAKYHGGDLILSAERRVHQDRLNTFVLSLPRG